MAVLLTLCDDFDPCVADSLAEQESAPFDLFILDDSTERVLMAEADAWACRRGEGVRVVRRSTRLGFKAGNINHWLSRHGRGGEYTHALLCDADVVAPRDFLARLRADAARSDVAFVQGCHRARPCDTWFQRAIRPLVAVEWLGLLPARNHWGLPQVLGHGVLIQIDDLIAAGGMPEVVSEDLALTIHLAERGRRGLICPQAIAEERLPETPERYRRRLRRWVAADAEIVRGYLMRILRSRLRPDEKLDLLLRETRLPMLGVFLLLLGVAAALVSRTGASALELPGKMAVIGAMVCAGSLPALWIDGGSILQRVRFILLAPLLSCGLLPYYLPSVWQACRGNVAFRPTNASMPERDRLDGFGHLFALLIGALLLLAGRSAAMPAFAAVGLAMVTAPFRGVRWFGLRTVVALSLVFWSLLAWQWANAVFCGSVPVEALLVAAGLSACRD